MGSGFSEVEFKDTIKLISTKDLTPEDIPKIQTFFEFTFLSVRVENYISPGEVK